jgi:predicted nucleotidyltransferase component of viral defense system
LIWEQAIVEWRREARWSANSMVEQDLVISRALVEMYSVPGLAERLAFRGGTALYKLHLRPPARYSEDIDLVQVRPEPIGETLDLLRGVLDRWLGTPQRKLEEGRVNLVYRFDSEDSPPLKMRLKIEINSREHFTELGLVKVPFEVDSQWFRGQADVSTFPVDELLGTKLRALYQRKKGRDLFDLWYALSQGKANPDTLVACFDRYMIEGGHAVTRLPPRHGPPSSTRVDLGLRRSPAIGVGRLGRTSTWRTVEGGWRMKSNYYSVFLPANTTGVALGALAKTLLKLLLVSEAALYSVRA